MDKPKEKRLLGIRSTRYSPGNSTFVRTIVFDCKYQSVANKLKSFGTVQRWCQSEYKHAYMLTVDTFYDYDEVLEYVKSLGKEKPEKKEIDRRYAIGQAASVCFSCSRTLCPFRWHYKMNINDEGFMPCPFRKRLDT